MKYTKFLMIGLALGFMMGCMPKVKSSPTPVKPLLPKGVNAASLKKAAPTVNPWEEPLFKYDYKKGEVKELCDKALTTLKEKLVAPADVLEMENAFAELSDAVGPLTFLQYVSQEEWTRDEAVDCETEQGKLATDIFTRRDLYAVVKNSKATNEQEARLFEDYARGFVKSGMALSDPDLEKFKELNKKLIKLQADFSENLGNDKTTLVVKEEELLGLSEEYIKNLKKNNEGSLLVPVKGPAYTMIMENGKVAETRRKMLDAWESRPNIPEKNITKETNTKLLNEAIAVRKQIAALFGKKSWSEYQIQNRMARNPLEVTEFLNDLKTRLQPRLKADLDILLKAKQQEDPTATKLDIWDIRYYETLVKKRDYSINEEEVQQYFPKDTVMKGMFEVYSAILGVTYEEVTGAPVWADGVKLYEVKDSKTHEILAYFYADLFPREGKYGHAAAATLIMGRVLPNNTYSVPISGIMSNYTPPTGEKPSLLTYDEVETTFHEFGHIMHQVLTRAPYTSLSGTTVARDFVEAPSQMLENWVLDPIVLNKLSGLYTDPTQKLPKKLIDQLIAAKDFNQGYFYSRQLTFGLTDMRIHAENAGEDANKVFRDTYQEVMTIPALEDTHFMASFGHMMGGYDSGYYGYLWSKVYAEDMFTAFEKEGLLSPERGAIYRKTILEQGGMKDAIDLVTEYLGRTPNREAFYKKLGL